MSFDKKFFNDLFRALRNKNYRLFFYGQTLSLVGTWIQQVALSWLIYSVTNSPFLLGFVMFAGQLPTFLIAPFAGVLADRYDKRKMIIITQAVAMLQAILLAIFVLTNHINVTVLIILNIILGISNAFDIPTRQSFVIQMVDHKEDLPNAIALNSSIVNGSRLIGPAIAGILVASLGEGICFLINAISFVFVIISLLLMKIEKEEKAGNEKVSILKQLKEGYQYSFGFLPIRSVILLLAVVSLFGNPYLVLLPVFAKDILSGNATTLGYLNSAVGIGALSAALYLASRKSTLGLGKIIATTTFIFAFSLVSFSFSKTFTLSVIILLFCGFGMMMQTAGSNTILQTLSNDDMRGRVMSFYTVAFRGMAPFGSLWAGTFADNFGAPVTVLISGIVCLGAGMLFFKNLKIIRIAAKPIYQQKGILPEAAKGVQVASNLSLPPED
ncbi:MAG: MFS transporter [Synergistaceae bacterium]|jgi:MFS family permease|nr:MFS transporter [Synergistaceae bacterium]